MCVYVCVHARAPYGAVVSAVGFQSKHCGFDPCRVRPHTSFFSFSISGWLPTAKCVCRVRKKREGLSSAKNSPCEPWGVRPGSSSGGQFDQPCKLFDDAVLAEVLC